MAYGMWNKTKHLLQHTAVVIGGIVLIVIGMAMTFSLIMVVPGIFVLALGVAVLIGGMFAHATAGP
jgi:hypothetical protein